MKASIKAYCDMLNEEQENRVLTGKLVRTALWRNMDNSGCLCGLAENWDPAATRYSGQQDVELGERRGRHPVAYEAPFDFERWDVDFGEIRDYLLEKQARRRLGPGSSVVPVEPAMRPRLATVGLAILLVLLA
jgi:hypothetical protein